MNIFEKLYLFFYLRKKKRALKNQKKLPLPVISIGNLTVGGTGKTPFTVALAKEAKSRGFSPVILTRGYRGRLKGPVLVTQQHDVDDVGDEAFMMAMDGLKVIKSIDRYNGGVFAIEKIGVSENSFFILDDGAQHWRLYRDLNIILIDGIKEFGNCKLIPFGPLRAPLNELYEAQMIFITKKRNQELNERLYKLGLKEIYFSPIKIEGIKDFYGNIIHPDGQTVFAFAGIGNFESFLEAIKTLNLKIRGKKKYIDHKKYNKKTIKEIINASKNCELILTTKKDFVKIKKFDSKISKKFCYLDISIVIDKNAADRIFSILSYSSKNHT